MWIIAKLTSILKIHFFSVYTVSADIDQPWTIELSSWSNNWTIIRNWLTITTWPASHTCYVTHKTIILMIMVVLEYFFLNFFFGFRLAAPFFWQWCAKYPKQTFFYTAIIDKPNNQTNQTQQQWHYLILIYIDNKVVLTFEKSAKLAKTVSKLCTRCVVFLFCLPKDHLIYNLILILALLV